MTEEQRELSKVVVETTTTLKLDGHNPLAKRLAKAWCAVFRATRDKDPDSTALRIVRQAYPGQAVSKTDPEGTLRALIARVLRDGAERVLTC